MMEGASVSFALAFLAGLVSFLSPCVFPIVPSYVGFVTGLTLDELRQGDRADARRRSPAAPTTAPWDRRQLSYCVPRYRDQ